MILLVIAAALGGLVFLKWRNGQSAPNPPPATVHPPNQPIFVPSPHPAPAPNPTPTAPASPVNLLDIGAAYQAQREAEQKQEALKGFLDAVVGFAKQGPTVPKAPTG